MLNWRTAPFLSLIGQSNYFYQKINQITALLESGQKLATKMKFWPLCSKQAVAPEQKAEYGKTKSQLLKSGDA